MNNPYEILGLTPDADAETVKAAYYEKLLQYRADRKDGGLDEFAQKKLDELNAAYDQIMGKTTHEKTEPSPLQYAEAHLKAGRLFEAERILSEISQQDAEWHYLMGILYQKRGWFDQAESYFEEAARLDPQNPRYQGGFEDPRYQQYQNQSNGMGYGCVPCCPLPCMCFPCCC